MSFRIETFNGHAGERTGTVYVLTDGKTRAEIWPFTGFNCLRWQVPTEHGLGDVLYTAPDWETNPVPTRSGHPVLFPFPNRLRAGRLEFAGTTYRLPLNDSTKQNAIHGFAPRVPWRVIEAQAGDEAASVTGQFRISIDAPESLALWPADATLTLTYRLSASDLQVDALVENHGPGLLPFGLGYHPYFRLPSAPEQSIDELIFSSAASTLWPLADSLPTGAEQPIPAELDFRTPRPLGPLTLDHLFGGLQTAPPSDDGFVCVAEISSLTKPGRVQIEVGPGYPFLVLFTPTHRKALAIEPYTCVSDAGTLASSHPGTGWRQLALGKSVKLSTRYRWIAR